MNDSSRGSRTDKPRLEGNEWVEQIEIAQARADKAVADLAESSNRLLQLAAELAQAHEDARAMLVELKNERSAVASMASELLVVQKNSEVLSSRLIDEAARTDAYVVELSRERAASAQALEELRNKLQAQ